GFTWATSAVKSGSVCTGMLVPGGLTGTPGVASVAAKPVWPAAKPASAVPASRTAASEVRRHVLPVGDVWLGWVIVTPSRKPVADRGHPPRWRRRHEDNVVADVNVPLLERLNRCHVH